MWHLIPHNKNIKQTTYTTNFENQKLKELLTRFTHALLKKNLHLPKYDKHGDLLLAGYPQPLTFSPDHGKKLTKPDQSQNHER